MRTINNSGGEMFHICGLEGQGEEGQNLETWGKVGMRP